MENAEHRWDEEQCGYRGEQQPTDDSAAKRGILFATISKTQGHRHHANDHGERGHQNGTESRESRLKRRSDGVFSFGHLFAGEFHYQDAVGGGYAHAHDGAGERWHAESGVGYEQKPGNSREGGR